MRAAYSQRTSTSYVSVQTGKVSVCGALDLLAIVQVTARRRRRAESD